MLDAVTGVIKKYKYFQKILLEECKYEIKQNKMKNLINDDQTQIDLIMNLIMNLIKVSKMINLLEIKSVF